MGTISSAFSLISSALNADQSALSIMANNVANANTPGYTRQTPNWQENEPVDIAGIRYGTGVTQTGATSVRDRVLKARLDQQQQLASASSARLGALNTMQTLFRPDTGASGATAGDIASDITSFFGSFASLEANPTNNPLRQQVLSTGSTLAGDISNAATSVHLQRTAVDRQAAGVTQQVNALTKQIAQLNLQIQSSSPQGDAGILEDQRQMALTKLSQLIGITQIPTESNGLEISTGDGRTLVSQGTTYELTNGMVGGLTHFFVGTTDVTAEIAGGGGELGGLLKARDTDIPGVLGALDQLAYSISTQVNAQNAAGSDLAVDDGAPSDIFSPRTVVEGSAEVMKMVMTDPNRIAAGGAGQGTGDNSNAIALANLGKQQIVDGQSPVNFYSGFVTTLGSTVSQVQMENVAENASVTQLQTQNNALSAVNLNDEAASLMMIERSYQAAAKVFSMLNTLMGSALNLGSQTTVS
jgi:flagellar hook-associated protein 1 FlgK